MENLPVLYEIEQNVPVEHEGIVVTTCNDEKIYCRSMKIIGGFIILLDAKICIKGQPSIKVIARRSYRSSEQAIMSYGNPVSQVMLQQNAIKRTTTVLKKEDLPAWMVRSQKEVIAILDQQQAVKNEENLKSNTKYLFTLITSAMRHECEKRMWPNWSKDHFNFFTKPRTEGSKINAYNKFYFQYTEEIDLSIVLEISAKYKDEFEWDVEELDRLIVKYNNE